MDRILLASQLAVSPTMMLLLLVLIVAAAALVGMLHFAENNAAMRGRKGQPLPVWMERTMRLFFLAMLMAPMCIVVDACVLKMPVLTLVCLLYAIPYTDLSEQRGGKPPILRKLPMWSLAKRYFSLQLVRTCPLDPEKQYIFSIHPHGILPFGSTIGMCHECPGGFKDLFPGVNFKTLVATAGFYVPLYRELNLYTGMADASRFSAKRLLNSKTSIALVPGGATEALYVDSNKDVLYLKNRKGFIKLALEHGVPIVPVYSFNENSTYQLYHKGNKTFNNLKIRFQKIFGLSLPMVRNLFPRRAPITVVVGKPVEVPLIENPSSEEVDHYLELYISKLKELFEENRYTYNVPKDKELVII